MCFGAGGLLRDETEIPHGSKRIGTKYHHRAGNLSCEMKRSRLCCPLVCTNRVIAANSRPMIRCACIRTQSSCRRDQEDVWRLSRPSLSCAASTSADLRTTSVTHRDSWQRKSRDRRETYSLSNKPITCPTLALRTSGGMSSVPLVFSTGPSGMSFA